MPARWNACTTGDRTRPGVEVIADPSGTRADAVFAHKRLSIIDVALSHEPLPYADGRYLLTFNGEIYNYLELREELARDFGASSPPRATAR